MKLRRSTRSATFALARQMREHTLQRARRARREALVVAPLLIAVLLAYDQRERLFGVDLPVRIAAVIALVVLGWALARDIGRVLAPALFRRLDPGTAGTVGFLIRLVTVAMTVVVALRFAGLKPETLAVGGAVTAVVFGLAAQQTFGNVFAGTVLLSARPFRVGDRVRFQGGGLAGQIEGTVKSLGLLYTTLRQGEDSVMVPNSVVLASAVVPLREPPAVDLRARLRAGATPGDVQMRLEDAISTVTLGPPDVSLEELDGDEVVMRICATPAASEDGPRLAEEVLSAVAKMRPPADNGSGGSP